MRRPGGSGTFVPVAGRDLARTAPWPGAPIHMVPDADGWYPIHPVGRSRLPALAAQLADLAVPQRFARDEDRAGRRVEDQDRRKRPRAACRSTIRGRTRSSPALAWRHVGALARGPPLPNACPVIRRTPGLDVEIRVECRGVGDPLPQRVCSSHAPAMGQALPRMDAGVLYDNWHTGPLDNARGRRPRASSSVMPWPTAPTRSGSTPRAAPSTRPVATTGRVRGGTTTGCIPGAIRAEHIADRGPLIQQAASFWCPAREACGHQATRLPRLWARAETGRARLGGGRGGHRGSNGASQSR
jgi:hypothetical protein